MQVVQVFQHVIQVFGQVKHVLTQVSQVNEQVYKHESEVTSTLQSPASQNFAEISQFTADPFSVVYVNAFLSVGKKLSSLLACSILKVYNGVLDERGVAAAQATAKNARAMLTAAITVICFLSRFSLPLHFFILYVLLLSIVSYKSLVVLIFWDYSRGC